MDSVYNSPPNWPAPPAGWTPPPGWTPDPSWPEPPQNWQFWAAAPCPSPARKRRRLWLIIGLPVALVALVIAGGITAFAVFLGNNLMPVRDAAGSYVQALQDQRYDAAFAMRCPESVVDHDRFVAQWTASSSIGHRVRAFTIVGTHVKSINGLTSGTVDVKVDYTDGKSYRERITLTKTGETWKPCD